MSGCFDCDAEAPVLFKARSGVYVCARCNKKRKEAEARDKEDAEDA